MTINEYCDMKGWSGADLARETGLSRFYCYQLLRGQITMPGMEKLIILRSVTRNLVTPNDFLPPYEERDNARGKHGKEQSRKAVGRAA